MGSASPSTTDFCYQVNGQESIAINWDCMLIVYSCIRIAVVFLVFFIGVTTIHFSGNPLIGVLRYKDHFFCFTSKEAAVKFAADPDR